MPGPETEIDAAPVITGFALMVTAFEADDAPHELVSAKFTVPVPAPLLGHVTVILLRPFTERAGAPFVELALQLYVTPVFMEDVYVMDEALE